MNLVNVLVIAGIVMQMGLCRAGTLEGVGSSAVSSTNASYDGTALVLSGHVTLDHGLGKMTAEEASLDRQEEKGKDFPFGLIHLHREVMLSLESKAQFTCEHAELDFINLKGRLTAKNHEKVRFFDTLYAKKGALACELNLLGEIVDLTFAKQELEGRKTEYAVETLEIKNAVEITYAHDFLLKAGRALYCRNDKSFSKEFQGTLSVYPQGAQSKCSLLHVGDVVEADEIDLDLLQSQLLLVSPKGTLRSSFLPHSSVEPLTFSCERLCWDQVKNQLQLQGNIHITDPTLGVVQAENQVDIIQAVVKGEKVLQTIHTEGPTTLTYHSEGAQGPSRISCQGVVHIDRNLLQVVLESPIVEGVVPEGEQLHYEEAELFFYADKACLEYAEHKGKLYPTSLTLKERVRLFVHSSEHPASCGLADRLHYSPETQTVVLLAHPGKRVLFWDEEQGLRMSAHEVHITQDPETKKRSIKGVGNLHFTFTPGEDALFQKYFPQANRL